MTDLTQRGIAALKRGDIPAARNYLTQAIKLDSQNATAWLALSFVVKTPDQKRYCLEQVLKSEPDNATAVKQLARLQPETTAENQPIAPDVPVDSPPVDTAVTHSPPEQPLRHRVSTRIAAFVGALFGEPYLPISLLFWLAILISTESVLVLIGQLPGYWLDYDKAYYGLPWLRQALVITPWLFLTVMALYIVLVSGILAVLNRTAASILWLALCFIHTRNATTWLKGGVSQLFENVSIPSQEIIGLVAAVIGLAVAGLLFSQTLLSPPAAAKTNGRNWRLLPMPAAATAVWFILLFFALVRVATITPEGWQPVITERQPSERMWGAIAYDSARQQAILFSGIYAWSGNAGFFHNDTWQWDGENWQALSPAQQPPGRSEHAMAFDEKRQVIVLFGGRSNDGPLGDTWEWDGQEWRHIIPTTSPAPRCCHRLWYDSEQERIILYGGYDRESIFYNDSWAWDGQNWTNIDNLASPAPVASGFASAYDPLNQQTVVLLAGWPVGTYIKRDGVWTRPTLPVEPPERSGQMVYDPQQQYALLFGGDHQARYFNDTWRFDGQEWQQLQSPLTPSGRYGHMLFFDERRQRIMLFGGFDVDGYQNDLWEFVPGDTQ
jgi:hypothetical protein